MALIGTQPVVTEVTSIGALWASGRSHGRSPDAVNRAAARGYLPQIRWSPLGRLTALQAEDGLARVGPWPQELEPLGVRHAGLKAPGEPSAGRQRKRYTQDDLRRKDTWGNL